MSKTVTIEIINDKAIKLLMDLELLQLIKMHKEKFQIVSSDWVNHYKGAMSRQAIDEIDNQLNEIREGWE